MTTATTHAERMDAIYRVQRHVYDATRKYYLLGRDDLIARLGPPPGGHVLEVGCGTARNLILAARRWPDARFHGLDIAQAMLDTAAGRIAATGMRGRIALARGDATALSPARAFGVAAFDRIVMSYTLSMIPDWQRAIAAALDALAPGGELHIVDFGQLERLPRAFRRLLFAWLGRFDVRPRADLVPVLRTLAAERGASLMIAAPYRGYAWSAVIRR